ncbi:MAG: PIN domain-containing protein [Bryobacter sp.]|jgi:hypothetical protein|nr:PIN domain-containing protein [Bryobacter sp.]
MIAIDTNLLVYAQRAESPQHLLALQVIEEAAAWGAGWGIPTPCVAEFWRVVTHPNLRPKPTSPERARRFLIGLADAGAQFFLPKHGFPERLLELGVKHDLRGRRLFDCQIALTCVDAGVQEIWTADRKFVRLPGLAVRFPLLAPGLGWEN